jgi:hypothetical protein
MFDEQPDGDIHGECAAEIKRLETELAKAHEYGYQYRQEHNRAEAELAALKANQLREQWNNRPHAWGDATAQTQSDAKAAVPDGWKLVAVNGSFSDLMYYLDRASVKGYLDRLYDLVEPWESFDYEYLDNPSTPEQE